MCSFFMYQTEKRRKITWNPEEMRVSNQGVQAIARRNYRLQGGGSDALAKKD